MRTSLLAVFAVVVACASLGAAQSCDSYTTAGTCTEAAGCGWCFDNLVLTGGSGVCSEGSRDGPADGATCNLWRYPCSRCFELYNDEETCVQNPDCGWCSSFSYCDVGDADGPTAGSCAAEDWTFGALNDNADETAVDGGGSFTSSPAFFAILGGVALLCIGLIVIVAIRVRSRSNSNPYSVKGDRTGDTTVVVAGDNALGNYLKRQISKKGSMIAKGGFGKVYKVKMADGSTIALKVVDADAPGAVMDFHREVSVLTKLTSADTAHPGSNHVIGMRCFCEDPLSVGLEFARRGSVWSYIKDRKVNMKESRRFLADAAFGVLFLHDNGIVHHDIKPQNFLLMDDNRVCVADFGNSEDLRPSGGGGGGAMFNPASHMASFASSVGSVGSSSAPKQILGTPQYLAPERYMQAIAGSSAVFNSSVETDPKASDVYSFGVVAWAITTHEKPFEDFEGDVAAEVAAEPSFRPPIPDFVDYSMGSLMERCWAGEPANRPTMQYVCNVLDEERSATTTDNPVFDDGATRVIAPSHPPSILASGMVTASSWSENGGDSVQLESLNTFENDFFDSVVSGNGAPPPIAPRSSGAPPPIAPRASGGGPPVVARRPAKPNKPKPAVKPRP